MALGKQMIKIYSFSLACKELKYMEMFTQIIEIYTYFN